MGIKLDFTNTDENKDFKALTPGAYRAHIAGVESRLGKQSGKPYLAVTFELPDENNRKAWSNYSLQPQSMWAIKALMVTLGFDPDELDGEFDLSEDQLLGQECVVHLGAPEEGKTTNPIEKVTSIDDWD